MVWLTTALEGTESIGIKVPNEFVAEVLNVVRETGRVTDETAAERSRLRVL